MKYRLLVLVLLIAVLPSFADSITFQTFAIQGADRVPLGPGLNPLLIAGISGGQESMVFGTLFGPIGTAVFSATLNLPGLQITSGPFTDMCTDPTGCIEITGASFPPFYRVTPGTLLVTLNGVTRTFDFRLQAAPVPEPATVSLLGAGFIAVLWRKHSAKYVSGRVHRDLVQSSGL